MADDFRIQETPIRNRDDAPSKLFGWTLSELGLIAGLFILTKWATQSTLTAMLVGALSVLYVKKVKDMLPEKFFQKFIAFQMSRHYRYRALARDTQWAPPIVAGSAKSATAVLWERLTGPSTKSAAAK